MSEKNNVLNRLKTHIMSESLSFVPLTRIEIDYIIGSLRGKKGEEDLSPLQEKLCNAQNDNIAGKFYPESLLNQICVMNGITVEDVVGRKKFRTLVDTRKVYSVICHEMFPSMSEARIGKTIDRDHATILYYYRTIDEVKELQDLYVKTRILLDSLQL